MAQQKFDWQAIDTVILDLDGTLIDLYFDHRGIQYAMVLH